MLLGLFMTTSKRQSRALYQMLSTHNNLAEQSLYLNLGYWETAHTYDSACEAMARLLGDAAQLNAEDAILDAGFGFADQDIYWVEQFSPRRIVGLNITPLQVDIAQQRVTGRGLDQRILLHHGSATHMPCQSAQFDKVMALEAAFHFSTREDFFREAHRVLKPGGRLAVADIIPLTVSPHDLRNRVAEYIGRSFWQIPQDNIYPRDVYVDKLRLAGFEHVQVCSVREHVYRPFAHYARRRLEEPEIVERMNPLLRRMLKISVWRETANATLDYLIVTADKPHA